MDEIVIVGASGHAKVVVDIVEREGRYRVAGFVEPSRPIGDEESGYPILGREADLGQLARERSLGGMLIAIGDNWARSQVAARLEACCPGLPLVTAVHPRANIARQVSIGPGSVVMAGVSVNPGCTIGQGCILNTNSSLDHDSVMEDFSSLAPRAATGGCCRIGAGAAVCIGATLANRVEIGEHTLIGAGATVLKSVGSCLVAYGTPARVARVRSPGERYL